VIWVPDWNGGNIARFTENGTLVGRYPTGGTNPFGVAVNQSNGEVWVTNYGSGSVTKLTKRGAISFTLTGLNNPAGIALDNAGHAWVAEHGTSSLIQISSSGQITNRIDTGIAGPYMVTMGKNGDVWAVTRSGSSSATGAILRLLAPSFTRVDWWRLSCGGYGIATASDGTIYGTHYANCRPNSLAKMDPSVGSGHGANAPLVSNNKNYIDLTAVAGDTTGGVWVASLNNSRVFRMDQSGIVSSDVSVAAVYGLQFYDNKVWVITSTRVMILNNTGGSLANFAHNGTSYGRGIFVGPGDTVNDPPVFSSTAPATATEGRPYFYQAKAADPEGHTVTYKLNSGPTGMWIHPETGKVHWMPAFGMAGVQTATIEANDGTGKVATQVFNISVAQGTRRGFDVIWGIGANNTVTRQNYQGTVLGNYPSGGTGPIALAVDGQSGEVWISNNTSDSVTKLDANGHVKLTIENIAKPLGIILDNNRDVWVAENDSSFVVRIKNDGSRIDRFGIKTRPNPRTIMRDTRGNIWVGTYSGSTGFVIMLDSNGQFVNEWDATRPVMDLTEDPSTGDILFSTWHSSGSNFYGRIDPTQSTYERITTPNQYGGSIAADAAGFVYLSIHNTSNTHRFAPNGQELNRWSTSTAYYGYIDSNNELLLNRSGNINVYDSRGVSMNRVYTFGTTNQNNNGYPHFGPGITTNAPPVFKSTPLTTAREGTPYFHTVKAEDPEGHPVTYSLKLAPSGMWINPETGQIHWLPAFGNTGTFTVEVVANDNTGQTASQSFNISVQSNTRSDYSVYWGIVSSTQVRKLDRNGKTIGTYLSGGTTPYALAVDQKTGDVWISNYGSDNVTKLDQSGHVKLTISNISKPWGITLDASGNAWVAESGDLSVLRIAANGSRVDRFAVCTIESPRTVIIDHAKNIWVVSNASATGLITMLDANGQLVNRWQIDRPALDLAADPLTGHVYFGLWHSSSSNRFGRINPKSSDVEYFTAPSTYVGAMGVDAAGFVWISVHNNGITYRFSPTATQVQSLSTSTAYYGYFDVNNEYFLNRSGNITVYTPQMASTGRVYSFGTSNQTNNGYPHFGPGTSANFPPEITSNPVTKATEGTAYFYQVVAKDPEGHKLTYSLPTAPTGMWIDSATGKIHWLPAFGTVGTHSVTVAVTDDGNLATQQSFNIQVDKGTRKGFQVMWGIIADNRVQRTDESGNFVAHHDTGGTNPRSVAVDPKTGHAWVTNYDSNNVVKLSPTGRMEHNIENLTQPWGVAIDAKGNAWVTEYGDAVVRISADGKQITRFSINGRANPRSIIITPKGDVWVSTHSAYVVQLDQHGNFVQEWAARSSVWSVAWDALNEELIFSGWHASLSNWFGRITPGNKDITYYTTPGQYGGGLAVDSAGFIYLSVHGTGRTYRFSPNGDNLTNWSTSTAYFATMSSDGELILNRTGHVYPYDSTGKHTGRVYTYHTNNQYNNGQVSYGPGQIVNQPPAFTSTPVRTATEGKPYFYQVAGKDPEGHLLEFSLKNAPAGMWISPTSGKIHWLPSFGIAGSHNVDVQISDSTGRTANQQFDIVVSQGTRIGFNVIWGIIDSDKLQKLDGSGNHIATYSTGGTTARSLAVDSRSGDVWITYSGSKEVVKMSTDGQVRFRIPGFADPWGIALDSGGSAWVADYGTNQVVQISYNGQHVRQFNVNDRPSPRVIIVDPSDNVWVGTYPSGNVGYVIRLDPSGNFVQEWATAGPVMDLSFDPYQEHCLYSPWRNATAAAHYGRIEPKTGKHTTIALPSYYVGAIATDPAGFVYVSVHQTSRTYRYSPEGDALNNWSTSTAYFAQLSPDNELLLNRSGAIHVYRPTGDHTNRSYTFAAVNQNNNGTPIFGPGTLMNKPPVFGSTPVTVATEGRPYFYVAFATDPEGQTVTYSLASKIPGMWINPQTGRVHWIPAFGSAGSHLVDIVASDSSGKTANQSFIITVSVGTRAEYLVWGVASISEVAAYNSVNGQQVGKYITNAGQPRSVAVDRISGNVWVTHYDSNTVVQLSSGGQILHSFSNLQKPWGVAIDGDGNAWVAENGSNSVARILRNGSAIDRFSAYNQPGPKGVAIDAYGNVWVGTHSGNNGTIVLLDAKGNFVSQWQSVRGVQDMAIDPTTQHLVFTIWDASLGNRIGRVDPAAKEIEYILLPSMYGGGIAIDQAGFIFVYVHNNKRFHRLSPLGQALESVATGVGYHASIDPNNELLVNVSGPVTIYNSTLQSAVRTFSFPAQNTNNNGAPFGPGSSTNRPPVITSTALTKAVTGDTYRYQVLATDPDGDPLTYILAKHPSGMQISVGTGLITWTPSPNQSGSHAVELTVSDGRGGVAKQSYTITVTQGNQPPKITSSPVTQVLFGQVYTYKVEATDPDGDPITFHLRRGPVGMQLHPTSGVLSWTPSNQDQGNHPVEVEARDNSGAFDTQFFVVTVRSANSPPKITSQPVTTATENRPYTYTVTATDPDGDNISFSLSASPTGMKIDAATGLILWTPAWGSKGDHIITIVASDGTVKDTQTFTLKVSAGNRPPTITSTPPTIAKEGQEYRYPVVASDPDGHSLTFKLTNHPTGMQIHPSSGLVTWTPTVKDQGVHLITITVEDSEGESTNQSYMLTVSGANNPPKFTSTPVTIAEQHQPYIYQATAIDPDRDTLSFKLLKAPAGMKIDPATGSVTWTPSQSDVGKHAVSIEVSDGLGGTDTQDFEITVKDVNDPPKITSTPPEEAEEEVNYVYDVKASDPDNDPLTFKLLLNPSGMTINPSSGQIMWLPPKGSAGTKHVVRVEVTDGRNGSDTQAWEIRVKAKISPNRKPQVLSTPLNIAYEGIKYVYAIIAIDPDGDPIVYKLKGGSPASASISPSGLIEWTPTKGDAGKDFTFEVELSDGKGGIEDHIFKVSVRTRCLVDSDCPPDHICSSASGQCVSGGCWLPGKGCPTGQICDPQGKCIADPCAKITCAANEFCRDGACIKACTGVKCAANEYCEDGVCKINRCSNTSCWPGQICEKETGLCIPDTCQQGTCGDGRICVDGRCIPDPCARITCPDPKTQVCINGQCIEPHTCKLDRDCPLATDICRAGKCVPGGCLAFGPGYCKAPFVCLADGRCGEPSCSGITCPQGEFCKDGKCLKVCADIVCGEGQICREGICIKDPCASITCNAGDICIDGKCEADLCLASGLCKPGQICIDNKCVPDPCAGVTCPNPNTQQCVRGDCIESSCRKDDDCGTGEFICVDGRCRKLECSLSNPCSANKRCREGYCILDPCANVSCPKHQFCVGGSCRMSCAGIFCNPDQHCVFGQCEQNPCANISCHTEEYCDPKSGTCQPNPCHSGGCVQGRICLNGVCVDDPCIHITCPNGQSCQAGQCKGELSCKGDSNCPGIAVCIQNKCIDPGCIAKPALCQQAEVCDDQGKCTADPCAKTKCSEREYCDASGTCTPICDACPGKERCAANGSCEPDPCADISCSADQICIEGVCEINDCKDIRCKHGRICKPGVGCIHDPCLSLLCPSGSSCQAGRCTVSATPSEIPHTEIPHTEIPHTEIPTPDASEPTDTIQPELHTELTPETPTEITPTTDVVGSPDIVLPEAIEPPAGCGCQHSSHIPIVPLFIFLIIALLALSRRKNLPTT
jgi:streptogramin lyase